MPAQDPHHSADRPDARNERRASEPDDRYMTVEDVTAVYADKADCFARWGWLDRLLTGRFRRGQFGDASGRVLDVACGTGVNFPYLPESTDLVGVDVSPAMLANAREELDERDRGGDLARMDAANLGFADDSFDTVISSLSTCTFPEPVAAIREMGRVCAPDGRVLLLEHGQSDVGPIARFLDWRAASHYDHYGCRWTQEPLELVRSAGLPIVAADTAVFGILTTIEASPTA